MRTAVTIAALGFVVALAGDVVLGAALVLALYALTAVVDGEPATVSVVLCGAVAVAIWAWWDPSRGAFAVALSAAVLGPLFGAGAVASGLWAALD